MSEALTPALLLAAAVLSCTVGFGWLALAMDVHWAQAWEVPGQTKAPAPAAPGTVRWLRGAGAAALAAALGLCLAADHASMAVLVWIMALAAGALAVAMTLAWRPTLLGWCLPLRRLAR